MKKTLTRILLIGLCLVSSLSQAWAASDGAISLTWENDAFTGTDNNYTNGVGFTWVSGAIDTDNDGLVEQWTDLWSFLPFVADSEYQTYASWSVVQEMNTPDDDTIPNPSEDDQPFSGSSISTVPCMHRRKTGCTSGNSSWGSLDLCPMPKMCSEGSTR